MKYPDTDQTLSGGTLIMATPAAKEPKYSKGDNASDFGDFMSNEDEEVDLEEVAEPW